MIFNVGAGGGASTADKVKYDNTESGLQSDNVQGAIDEVNNSLTADNAQRFQFAYDSESGKYGYKAKVEGADTFFPFSGLELHYVTVDTTYDNWSAKIETPSKVKFMYACTLGNGTPIGYLYSDGSYIETLEINSQMSVDITDTYFRVKYYYYDQYMKAFNFKIVYAT